MRKLHFLVSQMNSLKTFTTWKWVRMFKSMIIFTLKQFFLENNEINNKYCIKKKNTIWLKNTLHSKNINHLLRICRLESCTLAVIFWCISTTIFEFIEKKLLFLRNTTYLTHFFFFLFLQIDFVVDRTLNHNFYILSG